MHQEVMAKECNQTNANLDRRGLPVCKEQHKKKPLKTMEHMQLSMQDITNCLGMTYLQVKTEKRSLQRIGHVLRMDDEKPVKKANCG